MWLSRPQRKTWNFEACLLHWAEAEGPVRKVKCAGASPFSVKHYPALKETRAEWKNRYGA